MIGKLLQPEIAEIIQARDFTSLRVILSEWDPPDIAELLQDVGPQDQAIIFRLLPRETEAIVFEYLDAPAQHSLLFALGDKETGLLLNEMAPDDRTTLLEELPGNVTKQLINLLSPKERAVATRLLGYPEESIGRLMTPDYIAVRGDWDVQKVLEHIRKYGKDSETILMIYVTDERGKLVDDIRIRSILVAPLDARVGTLGDDRFVALRALDDQETAVNEFKRHDREALPVIDSDGVLVGIVTVDDVLDVAERETTEDIQKMGGTEALEEPYMRIAFGRMIRKRAGWLVILFLGEMLTATAMGYFQGEISKAVVLALFIPLVISSGGNSGSQASTLVIRAMALGEVKLRDWWRIMRRELLSGLALGTILGLIGFLRISVWSVFSPIYGPHWMLVALTVFFSLIGIVIWGTLSGSMLPMLLRKAGFDPAASSAPFVATLVDVTGLVIYFSVASIIMLGPDAGGLQGNWFSSSPLSSPASVHLHGTNKAFVEIVPDSTKKATKNKQGVTIVWLDTSARHPLLTTKGHWTGSPTEGYRFIEDSTGVIFALSRTDDTLSGMLRHGVDSQACVFVRK